MPHHKDGNDSPSAESDEARMVSKFSEIITE
ncbi:predicted protein [Sclerotinia sclerotiorum 1980 UF-70]|uniref:Uncharacterized protein n=1 Tax=Sclerotinia sclerotiorum (strain ATCC 18683 / 1980 / Ss-1) TaxID=665079 RepID=A7EUB1_SCLS1|nr:predicted protein [Sclerotinia sclerotiorum 1980 UF-70]EDN93053.1 predicted protein [Sclerotinia sclerotiorum 1980 UF-70]